LVLCGAEYTPERAFETLRKDRSYFTRSGGGVTFSGGECLAEPDFVAETAALCRAEGIHTAVESSLCVPESAVRAALDADMFIVDVKTMDCELHRQVAGVGNGLILDNIRLLSRLHANILIRVPLIPGVNDGDQNIIQTARFVAETGGGIRGMELLKYNNLARGKYMALGLPMPFYRENTQPDHELRRLADIAGMELPAGLTVVF
jgi:pyruvate formate lyase activating enzyme